jgi:hypothetical protein
MGMSLRPPKGLLLTKILAIWAKRVQAAAAAAAMRTTTTGKLLGVMRVRRRLTSQTRCFIRTIHTFEAACIFVHSLSFSEQLFCKL